MKHVIARHREAPRLAVFFVVVAALLSTVPAGFCAEHSAAEPSPAEVRHPEIRLLEEFEPELGTYEYEVAWNGARAGSASVTVDKEGDFYLISAEGKPRKSVDRFYKLRYRGEGKLSSIDLQPVESMLYSREGKKKRTTTIEYLEGGRVVSTEVKTKGKEDPRTKILDFQFDELVFDPFTAVFLIRRLDWEDDLSQEFEVFTGKDHYLVDLTAVELVELEVAEHKREAWAIAPAVENLTRPEKTPKLESPLLFISADEKRELLRIESKVFIGQMNVVLKKFVPKPAP